MIGRHILRSREILVNDMKIRDMIIEGMKILESCDIECAYCDAKLLAQHVLGYDYTRLTLNYMEEVADDKYNAFMSLIEKRKTHYPCQYLIGTKVFMGLTFDLSENVLIPRPETEILVEKALLSAHELDEMLCSERTLNVMDMCCGSGCIGLSYKYLRNQEGKNDNITLVDVSDYALSLTEKNAKKYKFDCNILKSNLYENVSGKYDMILSNPPYIRSKDCDELMDDVRLYEPRLALDGMEDGLYFYKKIIEEAGNYLYEDGVIIFEIGYDQAEDIRALLVDNHFCDVQVYKDYAGFDRTVVAKFRRI